MKNKFTRKLIDVEVRLGFLHIPSQGIELMPENATKLPMVIDEKNHDLTYNHTHRRIFGLTKWYKAHKAEVGDIAVLEKKDQKFHLSFGKTEKEKTLEEAETLIDISGLSSQSKGDIVEDRIKELIVLQGQGLLSVYRPVTDTQGIDLVVTKSGMYQPIFLQIKGRFNLQKQGYFLMDISKKTCAPHHSYFIVGAYFNPEKIEINEHIFFIPSHAIEKAPIVKSSIGERYRIANNLSPDSKGRWTEYLINKTKIAEKLLEKFEEMGKYIK